MIRQLVRFLVMATVRRMRGEAATTGLVKAMQTLEIEWTIFRSHVAGRARVCSALAGKTGHKLNLGCGANAKAGWVNVDVGPGAEYTLDLREPLPFADESCQVIYSEHFFEHIDYPDMAMRLLTDYFRLLESGGRLSIGVPDGELGLRAYAGDDPERFFAVSKERWHPRWANTRMEQINYLFRQGTEHRFIYDAETLVNALRHAGFVDVNRRKFEPGLDSPAREWGTLYVDGWRP